MAELVYDPHEKVWITSHNNLSESEKWKMMSQIDGAEFDLHKGIWKIPVHKRTAEQLQESFGRSLVMDPEAQAVMQRTLNQREYRLDYDPKSRRFELYISQLEGKSVADRIGGCNYRSRKGCYSIPANMWSLYQLYGMIGQNHIEPSPEAKERLDFYTYKVQELLPVVNKVRTIKPVPVEKIPLDGFVFRGKYQPYEHQVKMWWSGYNVLRFEETGFFYFCGVGTGKSLASSNVAVALKEKGIVRKVLVVTPSHLKYNFAQQIEVHTQERVNTLVDYAEDLRKGRSGRRWRWTRSDIPITEYFNGLRDFTEEIDPDALFTVVSYESIKADWKRFKDYDMILFDEVHYLKTHTSGRTKEVKKLTELIPRRLGMTGTPIANTPLDLWSMYDVLDPDIFPNRFSDYENTIAVKITVGREGGRQFPKIVDWKNLDWVNRNIFSRAIQYRTQECLDLPEKTYSQVTVQMPDDIRIIYDDLKEHLVAEIGQMGEEGYEYIESPNRLAVISKLRQLSSGIIGTPSPDDPTETQYRLLHDFKLQAMADLVEDLTKEHQIIIWYFHTFLKDHAIEVLRRRKIKAGVIEGGMDNLEKAAVVHRFQMGAERVLFWNIQLPEGETVTSGDVAIYLENSYSYMAREQSEGRIWRPGQTKKTVFVDLVTEDSLDMHIIDAIKRKADLSDQVLLESVYGR